MLSEMYRGRLSIPEVMNMPLSDINMLYYIYSEKAKTKEGKKELQSQALESQLEEALTS